MQTRVYITLLVILLGTTIGLTSVLYNAFSYIEYLESQSPIFSAQISMLDRQIHSLREQIEQLQAPKLVMSSLKVEDVRPPDGKPFLHISGSIFNIGEKTAYNSKLRVIAYREVTTTGIKIEEPCIGTDAFTLSHHATTQHVTIIDEHVPLGTVPGGSFKTVNENIHYNGGVLTNWAITIE